ncbi:uncharacterized protein EAE98_008474 [Botrytis deweyae]|uniref:Uncharacterized protein n=1 Tax=Botrytis deweyae TaxID=2478750 RepID=A0ABQ7IEA9_9HELO|nr:uncharacterized protein EAE98_008474 [Botrytis deweyae]KAF7921627.1 hypothetical protein EAE98_008474 [Botrytis deweyae]
MPSIKFSININIKPKISGQNSGDLDWATPSVAQRWVKKISSLETHRPRESGTSSRSPTGENLTPTRSGTEQKAHHSGAQPRTNEVPDEDSIMIDAPSVSSGNERERFFDDPTRNNGPFARGQINNAVYGGIPQKRTLFPTDPAPERLSGRRSAENDRIDTFGYPVGSENARPPNHRRRFRSRRTTREEHVGEGGSVRGGAPVRSDEPARGGSHNSEFFTPGGTSQSRGS